MKTKQRKSPRVIKKDKNAWKQRKTWAQFVQELNDLRSEGDIRQDRIKSVPLSCLPMV